MNVQSMRIVKFTTRNAERRQRPRILRMLRTSNGGGLVNSPPCHRMSSSSLVELPAAGEKTWICPSSAAARARRCPRVPRQNQIVTIENAAGQQLGRALVLWVENDRAHVSSKRDRKSRLFRADPVRMCWREVRSDGRSDLADRFTV